MLVVERAFMFAISGAACARSWPAANSSANAIVRPRSELATEGTCFKRFPIKCTKQASAEQSPALAVGGAYSKRSEVDLAAKLKNAPRERTGDLSKSRGASVAHVGIVPVDPVEGIKRIGLELEVDTFAETQSKCFSER